MQRGNVAVPVAPQLETRLPRGSSAATAAPEPPPSTSPPTTPPVPSVPPSDVPTAPDGLDVVEIPSPADRHLLSRFSFGVSPALVDAAAAAGGARRWFEDQLEPADIPDGEA